ncbi:MAG: LLM class flavin-dependent oxidoreductase [Gammaproteobacteria bacterium]|nr:LLM class flavin-dependent oxidoreductase [Gammaproteobacteria bacterium]
MNVDLILQPHFSAAEVARLGALAESYGIGGVWATNHLDGRDPFVNFVPLAEHTTRLRMGPTALSPFEVHPAKMAGLLLTLNEISGGRAQVAVGGGGGTLQSMGMKPARMVRAVRECLEILRLAASGKPGPYRGEVFKMHWLNTSWAKAPPPLILAAANGPQMLKMAARHADGIMTSDFTPARLRWARALIDPVLYATGRDRASFPFINFWAWHVKESREAAQAEARTYLMARGTIWEPYIHDVVTPDEATVVARHYPAFVRAYDRRSPDIQGVPEDILAKIVERGVSASAVADIDFEIERLREMHRAGVTGVVLCLYNDAAEAIRVIGERVVPALRDL